MERTIQPAGKLQWRKIGGGSLRLFGRIIKPNERFFAFTDEIPPSFRSSVVCLDEVKMKQQETQTREKLEKPEELYTLKHKGGGKWDIVDEEGKALNEAPLSKARAAELLSALQ